MSRLILNRIETLQLPCEIRPQGEQLLSNCSALYALAVAELKAVAANCEQIKIKAMRSAAATKASALVCKIRALIEPMQMRGVTVPTEESELVEELSNRINEILPKQSAGSDDEDYF